MNRRRSQLTIAMLASAALLAGCGSGSSSPSTSGSSTARTQSAPAKSSTGATALPASQIKAAVAECKQVIQSQNKLPASAKKKLEGACTDAAKGNTGAVKAAAREVCEEVIGKANLPNGSAKKAAQQACKK
jgi:hypothetical protein